MIIESEWWRKKQKIAEKNEGLINSFKSRLGKHYYEEWCTHDKFDIRNWRQYIRSWDIIKFNTLMEFRDFLDDGFNYNFSSSIGRGYVTLKIDSSNGWNLDDLEFVLKHLDLWTYPVGLSFPSLFFTYYNGSCKKVIKLLEKFILKQWNQNCYFDLWNKVSRGEYWDKTDYLKELISRFTKNGRSWKIQNCVIKVNWKEYHSSWDYKYEFNLDKK